MCQVEVYLKSEMTGPFHRGDTIINEHFIITNKMFNYRTKIS